MTRVGVAGSCSALEPVRRGLCVGVELRFSGCERLHCAGLRRNAIFVGAPPVCGLRSAFGTKCRAERLDRSLEKSAWQLISESCHRAILRHGGYEFRRHGNLRDFVGGGEIIFHFFVFKVTGTRADTQNHLGGDDLDFLKNSCWNGSGSFQGTCQMYTA